MMFRMFRVFLSLILIILLIVLGVALGGGLLVLLAYGVGWVLTRFLPLSSFEASLLSLVGVIAAAWLAVRLSATLPARETPNADDEEDDELLDEEEEEEDRYAGIPRWRRPRSELDFEDVRPDDRCPCGSGRKYKNCHGRRQKKQAPR